MDGSASRKTSRVGGLAGDYSDDAVGTTIDVDGGMTLYPAFATGD
jgi:hypothetical protein